MKVVIDPESTSLQKRFAIIHTPRKNRQRYPEACVNPVATEAEAIKGAQAGPRFHAAIVYGPSVSSESQRIYYLVNWLT